MKHRKFRRTHTTKSGIKQKSRQRQRGTVKMQGVVEAIVRDRKWEDKLYEVSVFNVWESVVGEDIAKQSVPVSLSNGILRVEVVHQVYTNELSVMKTEILSKLQKKLESVNARRRKPIRKNRVVDIYFRFNPYISIMRNGESETKSESSHRQKDQDIRMNSKPISPELMDRIEAAVSVVSDAELREALKSLFITQCGDIESAE